MLLSIFFNYHVQIHRSTVVVSFYQGRNASKKRCSGCSNNNDETEDIEGTAEAENEEEEEEEEAEDEEKEEEETEVKKIRTNTVFNKYIFFKQDQMLVSILHQGKKASEKRFSGCSSIQDVEETEEGAEEDTMEVDDEKK